MKKWTELEDGGSDRWLYAREVAPLCWVFLCIDDMVDCCGADAESYFCAAVSVVDVTRVSQETLNSALSCCGAASWLDQVPKESKFLAMAQCLHDAGSKAPCWEMSSPPINKERNKNWRWDVPSDSSPTFLRLRAAARRFAEEHLLEERRRNELLDTRIVNAVGQTAREFSNGGQGLWDALRRIKENPQASDEQKLVLRLYQEAGQTLGIGPVPEDIKEP